MRSGEPERTIVGQKGATTSQARLRLLGAHYARQKRRTAATQDQRWFREQQEEAQHLLRRILNEASREVLLVDPYLAANELAGFSPAVGRNDIPIRILTSAEILRNSAGVSSHLEKGDELLEVAQQLKAHNAMNPIEVRVMPGARPAVHDRFLVIDDRIWLLGSSLNEFGARGTMLLALPDPDAIRGDLRRAWDEADALEPWVNRRRDARSVAAGGDAV
jgi:hypothetical protein